MPRETHVRSLLKGLSWRIVASITTFVIAYVITGSTRLAIEIGAVEVVTKIFFYYIHERAWQLLPRGTIRHIESDVLSKRKKRPLKDLE